MTLPATLLSPLDLAAAIGLPPLSEEGNELLLAIQHAVTQQWECWSGDFSELTTSALATVKTTVGGRDGNPALHLNCASGYIATSIGAIRGNPSDLAPLRAQHLAHHVIANLIAEDQRDGAHTTIPATLIVNGAVSLKNMRIPSGGPDATGMTITCFSEGPGSGAGTIEQGRLSVPWKYSNGILGVPEGASADLGAPSSWVRIAVCSALLACSRVIP